MAENEAVASERTLEGGSYEVIRRRLLEHAAELLRRAEALNARRTALFGGRELALVATERVRTENNCVPRDVVSVGGQLLFGFQVFIGLKTETRVSDVFGLHRFTRTDSGFDLSQVPFDGTFLADADFDKQFRDAFKYSKDARLLQLVRMDNRLLAVVQIGQTLKDIKVFRFAIDARGQVVFMDARGEEDYAPPRAHPFEWVQTRREHHVSGRHPHVNVLNQVFIETIGGDLTVKIENNTETGQGIYREPVDDPNQTLDDAEIAYAQVSGLILLRVKPFREERTRYLIFNPRTQSVLRVDALGAACVELPEDHGVIFPGGYYLTSGEHKLFEGDADQVELERVLPSPNGEDVLYVFYRPAEGEYQLLSYNLIEKEVKNPIKCHGYSLFDDGTMLVFRASPSEEPSRIHPVQIWQTPYSTSEFAASAPTDGSYLAKVGNADLVSGLSEILSIRRLANTEKPTRRTFEDLGAATRRVLDTHYWLGHAETGNLAETLTEVGTTTELIVDEFEKMLALEKRAREAVLETEQKQAALLERTRPSDQKTVDAFLGALTELKRHRGALITLKELRLVDVGRVEALESRVATHFDELSRACVDFFLAENAFQPLLDRLDVLVAKVGEVGKVAELVPLKTELDSVQEGLSLLSETISGLPIDDATVRTKILDGTSSAFAQQNRARAVLDGRREVLARSEGRAEFTVKFKLLGQSVTSSLSLATTPEACDDQLGKLMLQLEELEGRFGQVEEFATELAQKREDVLDAVSARRQVLVEERQRRAQALASAAERIFAGIARRAQTLGTADELNAYFAADPMVQKLSELEAQLRQLGDSVRADELSAKQKSAKQNALRALRDKTDLLEDDGSVIRLGKHRFTVNTRPLELSIVPREGVLCTHLTGTDFYEPITDARLESARDLWERELPSECSTVYRGEFLAVSLLLEAEAGAEGRNLAELQRAAREGTLAEVVRVAAASRLDEGYERGVHDADATAILEKLLTLVASAGALRYSPAARAAGWLFWQSLAADRKNLIERRAVSACRLRERLGDASAEEQLARELAAEIESSSKAWGQGDVARRSRFAARYLVCEVGGAARKLTESAASAELRAGFWRHLEETGAARGLEEDLRVLSAHPAEGLGVALSYVDAYLRRAGAAAEYRLEIAARLVADSENEFVVSDAVTRATVTGLLGQHVRLTSRELGVELWEILERVSSFREDETPRFRAFRTLRATVATEQRDRLRLGELQAKVLTSFVRNRLIDEVYLPLVGQNLAKQLGAAGANKRTDQMGLLLLVSPPGYGKTTLMEYVASKLGLVFVKVNGPAIGAEVKSLDPREAPNATARQEVEKINLALEMGNNVMLYLDDIQHTHPELLQKFISLCDAQRRIEGVWNGKSRTYDLRGKKFCIVMAGNPYTESGARFQIPDMLANRADTYNLGDILDGKKDAFALSYLENGLTSNPLLAPLAGRDAGDVHKLIAMARGEEVAQSELSHAYSSGEVTELVELFRRLFKVRDVLLRVNLEYIASASQDDRFRSEPPFKLQGSYRNMNKLAEKVVPAMNDAEIERLIDDHYASESQTLTKGAEQNLLKLAEMRGRLSAEQAARWADIKDGFVRAVRMGGSSEDPVSRITGTLSGLDVQLKGIRDALGKALQTESKQGLGSGLIELTDGLASRLAEVGRPRLDVRLEGGEPDGVVYRLLAQQTELITEAFSVLRAGGGKGSADGEARITRLSEELARLAKQVARNVRHVVAQLSSNSATNFFKPLDAGDDAFYDEGGIFIATYEVPPPLGADVRVDLSFPTGQSCEFFGRVAWVRDYSSDDAPAGYGVRFDELAPEARSLIAAYAEARDPLLCD